MLLSDAVGAVAVVYHPVARAQQLSVAAPVAAAAATAATAATAAATGGRGSSST